MNQETLDRELIPASKSSKVPADVKREKQSNGIKGADGILLAARILIALLFLIFGWQKVFAYSGTVQYMAHVGAPMPALAAVIAIIMEAFVSIAIMLGVATRPLAILLAIYTLGAGLIAHHYWSMTGMDRLMNEINFYKNISIIGGLLVLYVTGAGGYSVDRWWGRRRAPGESASGGELGSDQGKTSPI